MRKPGFAICPEGASAIGFTAFSGLIFSILDWWPLALLFWILFWFSLNFFRDPERIVPSAPDVAVSPADGKIIKITYRQEPFSGENVQCVSVFMNIFSVHVNRVPVECTIKDIAYFPGKFINASFDKASEDNERCAWLISAPDGANWTMVQIAGLVARRIAGLAEAGDHLEKGQRFGMIRFGSRVDLYLPPDYTPVVQIGDRVFGGETVIARTK